MYSYISPYNGIYMYHLVHDVDFRFRGFTLRIDRQLGLE